MVSCMLVFLVMAMAPNRGTVGFVFGPLAAFTVSQESSTAVNVVPSQRPVVDATRHPIRRRPNPTHVAREAPEMAFVFPSDDDNEFPSFDTRANNPNPNPNRNPNHNLNRNPNHNLNPNPNHNLHPNPNHNLHPNPNHNLNPNPNHNHNPSLNQNPNHDLYPRPNPNHNQHDVAAGVQSETDLTEHRLSPRPTQAQTSNGALVFDGPSSSSQHFGDRGRLRPNRRPQGTRPPTSPPGMSTPPEEPPPCMCPTTSEFNPVCVEIEGSRVTLQNTSELKCAPICTGLSVKLLFHGTCRRSINLINPFIHD